MTSPTIRVSQVNAKIQINNSSRKQVKNIKAQIVQHCEVTMVNKHFTRVVAEMETREGCPITPGATLSKTFHLTPLAKNSKDKGVALDGQLKVSRLLLSRHPDCLSLLDALSLSTLKGKMIMWDAISNQTFYSHTKL